jgi:acyl-homoserine lactone acylase PvdQ
MAKRDDKWVTLRSNNRNKSSLVQSWLRTKATGFKDYRKIMDMRANASNNTVFADDKGNIAYWHGNFVPIRDKRLNWSKVIDGSISATEWKGLHPVKKLVHSYNPPNGWLQNCNSTPYTAAAENSPERSDYRPYMAPDGENFRGINAVRVLNKQETFTIDDVIAAGYDRYLSAFEILIPALIKVYEKDLVQQNPLYEKLREPIAILKAWDFYSDEKSIATTLAIEWAQRLDNSIQRVYIDEGQTDQVENTVRFAANATTDQVLPQLLVVLQELEAKFGTWQVPWGELNRFQRLTGDINSRFDDQQPSWPVGNCSAVWGCLPAYKSDYTVVSKKRYGNNGNSFVCVVEFGPTIKAKSLLAGGESGDPASPHFKDQAERYSKGIFKEVLFYKEEVKKNAEREYHPGE